MSRGTIEIPIEVWEGCERDAERIALLHKQVAALAAEVERLRKHRNTLIERLDKSIEDINNVAADNERLRKAGDAMAAYLDECDYFQPSLAAWLAAKEGWGAK